MACIFFSPNESGRVRPISISVNWFPAGKAWAIFLLFLELLLELLKPGSHRLSFLVVLVSRPKTCSRWQKDDVLDCWFRGYACFFWPLRFSVLPEHLFSGIGERCITTSVCFTFSYHSVSLEVLFLMFFQNQLWRQSLNWGSNILMLVSK